MSFRRKYVKINGMKSGKIKNDSTKLCVKKPFISQPGPQQSICREFSAQGPHFCFSKKRGTYSILQSIMYSCSCARAFTPLIEYTYILCGLCHVSQLMGIIIASFWAWLDGLKIMREWECMKHSFIKTSQIKKQVLKMFNKYWASLISKMFYELNTILTKFKS